MDNSIRPDTSKTVWKLPAPVARRSQSGSPGVRLLAGQRRCGQQQHNGDAEPRTTLHHASILAPSINCFIPSTGKH